jgi:diguanylate cyclase (GGDEF)-like protein
VSKADELRLLRGAIKSFPEALAVRDADGRLIASSDAYAHLAAAAPDGAAEFQSAEGRWLRRTLRALEGGGSVELIADVTDLRSAEQASRFLAYHDSLTGLPNRRLLDDRLRQALFAAQRRDARVAVMMVDLDRFKQVNDALGHRAGDSVLREVAHRLTGCVRKADTLARHGGDEFVVVLSDLQMESDCQVVAEKILRALEAPFRVDGREFSIGASIGISLFPADAGDGEALLRNADVAMYRAKQLGANNYRFYGR